MSGEIKIDPKEINHAVHQLEQAIEAFDIGTAIRIEGKNQMHFVDKLNHIDHRFKQLLQQYQAVLLQSSQTTNQAVADFVETDEDISMQIEASK